MKEALQDALPVLAQALRGAADDRLLVQIGRRMELKPRAEKLQPVVRDLLLHIDSTIAVPPPFEPHRSDRVLRVLASDYTQIVLGPALMSLGARQHSTAR